jgi:hypothetical protein
MVVDIKEDGAGAGVGVTVEVVVGVVVWIGVAVEQFRPSAMQQTKHTEKRMRPRISNVKG